MEILILYYWIIITKPWHSASHGVTLGGLPLLILDSISDWSDSGHKYGSALVSKGIKAPLRNVWLTFTCIYLLKCIIIYHRQG